jgi:hypothetical protein
LVCTTGGGIISFSISVACSGYPVVRTRGPARVEGSRVARDRDAAGVRELEIHLAALSGAPAKRRPP